MKKRGWDIGAVVFLAIVIGIMVAGIVTTLKPRPTPEISFIDPTAPRVALWTPSATCSDITDRSCDVREPDYGPPALIKVGATRLHVYFRASKDMHGDWGVVNYEREIILLDASQPLETMRDSLWHELTHAAIKIGTGRNGLNDGANEDEFIEASVPTQLLILQENPRLRKWLGL